MDVSFLRSERRRANIDVGYPIEAFLLRSAVSRSSCDLEPQGLVKRDARSLSETLIAE